VWSDAQKKSHVGILDKEKADAAAKSALSLSVILMKLPSTDLYPRITKLIRGVAGNYMLLGLLYVTTNRKHVYRTVIQYC